MASCTCWTVENLIESPVEVSYTDCSSNPSTIIVEPTQIIKICAYDINLSDSYKVFNTENLCVNGECVCRCFLVVNESIDLTTTLPIDVPYLDCDGIGQSLHIDGGSSDFTYSTKVCAIYVDPVPPFPSITLWASKMGDPCIGGDCPCKCYYVVNQDKWKTNYFDCNGNYTVIDSNMYPNQDIVRFCTSYVDAFQGNIFDSGEYCNLYNCNDFCCNCYIVTNNTGKKLSIQYLDCDYNLLSLEMADSGPTTFCGLNVQYLIDGEANYTPTPHDGIDTIIDTCVNGQCLSTLSTKDQLLYKLNTTLGPCPNNCCGKTAAFGAYLLRNNGNTPGTYSIR